MDYVLSLNDLQIILVLNMSLVLLDQITLQYVVAGCYPPFKFYFHLFWGMLAYHNDFETKRNKTSASTKDKIEQICLPHLDTLRSSPT